jgi:hypothetical protein
VKKIQIERDLVEKFERVSLEAFGQLTLRWCILSGGTFRSTLLD